MSAEKIEENDQLPKAIRIVENPDQKTNTQRRISKLLGKVNAVKKNWMQY
jgi:hypothetical protein